MDKQQKIIIEITVEIHGSESEAEKKKTSSS